MMAAKNCDIITSEQYGKLLERYGQQQQSENKSPGQIRWDLKNCAIQKLRKFSDTQLNEITNRIITKKPVNRNCDKGKSRQHQPKLTKDKTIALIQEFNTARLSITAFCQKHEISPPTWYRALDRIGAKTFKKQKIPKVNGLQIEKQIDRSRHLHDFLADNNFIIIQDDETYRKLHETAQTHYIATPGEEVSVVLRTIECEKYALKVLIWIAISPLGCSDVFVVKSGYAINQKTYRDILEKYLIPFYKKMSERGKPIFWPDLASSHYAHSVLDFMEENGIRYVEKEINPPALPEVRPIERFWAHMKQKLFANGAQYETHDEFAIAVKSLVAKYQENTQENIDYFAGLFKSVLTNLDKVAEYGRDSLH